MVPMFQVFTPYVHSTSSLFSGLLGVLPFTFLPVLLIVLFTIGNWSRVVVATEVLIEGLAGRLPIPSNRGQFV